MWVKNTATYIGVCSVIIEAFGNVFMNFSNFQFFDPIPAYSPPKNAAFEG